MDKTCWFYRDFSACWYGNIGVEGGCVIVWDAHIGMLGAWVPDSARGPDNSHVGPIGGGLGGLPTMPPIGFSCELAG